MCKPPPIRREPKLHNLGVAGLIRLSEVYFITPCHVTRARPKLPDFAYFNVGVRDRTLEVGGEPKYVLAQRAALIAAIEGEDNGLTD